jgi:hypothetical protein
MIQRIQTAYLLFALACLVALWFLPLWKSNGQGMMEEIGAGSHMFLTPFPLLLGILHIAAIFSFRKRKIQAALCLVNIILMLVFIAFSFFFIYAEAGVNFAIPQLQIGLLLPLAVLLLNVLARRAVKRDEDFVRSMDRLR